jgi:uncharacterized protein YyaL (SSP411 family)
LSATAKTYLLTAQQASDRLLEALEKLRVTRAERPRPLLDDKIITAWNGLMISGFARGYQVLRDADYLTAATRAAEFLRCELYDEKRQVLFRSWRAPRSTVEGFAEDYAFLIQGLLARDYWISTKEVSSGDGSNGRSNSSA